MVPPHPGRCVVTLKPSSAPLKGPRDTHSTCAPPIRAPARLIPGTPPFTPGRGWPGGCSPSLDVRTPVKPGPATAGESGSGPSCSRLSELIWDPSLPAALLRLASEERSRWLPAPRERSGSPPHHRGSPCSLKETSARSPLQTGWQAPLPWQQGWGANTQ